jgi:hypothetical protein
MVEIFRNGRKLRCLRDIDAGSAAQDGRKAASLMDDRTQTYWRGLGAFLPIIFNRS